ncbi:4'-phosphopantetheinyl transferase superfamily protein [Arthrobacter sp.]|uniref:4'-phosphopantetheinyl transferase family protein n=1 Tax=Arthrobacter sp. TaxID=1667 RepID=UPI002810EC5B|nr:4'-phosphopantetheinyl transferase superfamily protein [Arthrobacter sp.]
MMPADAHHGISLAAVRLADVDLGQEHMLDGAELARADTFRSRGLRERFVAGRIALRLHISALTGDNPASLKADYFCPSCRNRNGKGHGLPRYQLPSKTTIGSLHVSLSRSGTWCLLAASLNEGIAGIGVDIETGSSADFVGFEELAMSANERSQLQRVPVALRNAFQTRLWCRKEAVLKALGTGLATAPSLLDVSGSAPAVPGSPSGSKLWKLEDISPASVGLPEGFAATLAVRQRDEAAPDSGP